MKHVIHGTLNKLGYKISRLDPIPPAFSAQKTLLSSVQSPIIFDIGANIGQTIDIYRKLFPSSKIFAFEPFKDSFDKVNKKTKEDINTKVFKLALGSICGSQTFHINSSSPTNSLLVTDRHGPKVWGQGLLETVETIEVDVIKLDEFLDNNKIEYIDLVKMDVQGAEHLVLEGASEALEKNKIGIIYTEIITLPTYVGQKRFHEMLQIFEKNNFLLYNIYNFSNIDGWLRQIDAILINKNFENILSIFE